MSDLRVHLLPPVNGLPEPDGSAVIVDVLRASTTIATALDAGALSLVPCATVDQARSVADETGCLLGGERGGQKIDGFDLGNSPRDYTAAAVRGKSVAFTTTNGTRALLTADRAARVYVGSFVNLTAVATRLCSLGGPVDIVCAGTDGVVTSEDVLFAGMLATRVQAAGGHAVSDAARIAMDFSRLNAENPEERLRTMRESHGGRNLIALGFDADIAFAAQLDRFSHVPACHADQGRIFLKHG